VSELHQGAPGLAHGGVLAAAFDEALGAAAELAHQPLVTVRLECDFHKPVPVGATLHITARCTGVDGRKVYTAGAARLGPDGPVAARAAGLFLAVPPEHFELGA
jgi:acyl-coenzyme A thioesterase PaaI-like protein